MVPTSTSSLPTHEGLQPAAQVWAGASFIYSYKKVKIFCSHFIVPLEYELIRSRQRQLVTDTGIPALKYV